MIQVEVCGGCDGKGYVRCPICDGSGAVRKKIGALQESHSPEMSECQNCLGTGRIICKMCEGVGKILPDKAGSAKE